VDCYLSQHDQHYLNDRNDDMCHVTRTAMTPSGRTDEVDSGPLQMNGTPPTGDDQRKEVLEDGNEELDADGFRVEHRYETECVSRSKEVRDVSEDCTELRLRETKEVTLEELKIKDIVTRQATAEERRALLEAQEFEGEEEIEIGREVIVEEFTRVESQREEVINKHSCR